TRNLSGAWKASENSCPTTSSGSPFALTSFTVAEKVWGVASFVGAMTERNRLRPERRAFFASGSSAARVVTGSQLQARASPARTRRREARGWFMLGSVMDEDRDVNGFWVWVRNAELVRSSKFKVQ